MPGEGTYRATRIMDYLFDKALFCPFCASELILADKKTKKCSNGHGILYTSEEYFSELNFDVDDSFYEDVE